MHKDKVKVTIMFRGREVTHPDLGRAILARLTRELEPIGTVEQRPNLDGRNMTMVLGPSKEVISGEITEFEPLDFSAEIAAAQAEADAEAFARSIAASAPPAREEVEVEVAEAEVAEEIVADEVAVGADGEVAEEAAKEIVEVAAESPGDTPDAA
jgi:translation initiation factor IF-3